MKKPEVTLENYEEVYKYYAQYKQPKVGAYIGHAAMALGFKPDVQYAPGAEEAIHDIVRNPNGRAIMAFNHLSDRDQYVVAAMALRERVFRPMIGNTFIQSKEILSHHPVRILRPFLRRGVDIMGGMPTIRKKDVGEGHDDLRRAAAGANLDASTAKIQGGQHMAGFPEGARNKEFPETVQELKPGIAVIAGRVAATHELGVIPIGFTYGDDTRHPVMWVDTPMTDMSFEPELFLPDLHGRMQASVDRALDRAAV